MSDIKELTQLEHDTQVAVKRVAAGFIATNDLLNDFNKLKSEKDPKQGVHEAKHAIRGLRWVGRSGYKIGQILHELQFDATKVEELLPEQLKSKEEDLMEKVHVIEANLITIMSRYTGELNEEMNEILTDEQLLAKYEGDPHHAGSVPQIRAHLQDLFAKTEKLIEELVGWLNGAQALLEKIVGFEALLEQYAQQ